MLCPINEKKERLVKYHEVKGQASNPKLAMKVAFFVEFVSAADWSLQFPVWEGFRVFFFRFGTGGF